jgi:hypothetical protein
MSEIRRTPATIPTLAITLTRLGEHFKSAAQEYGAQTFRRWLKGEGYRTHTVPKPNTNQRRSVYAPEEELKEIQRSLLPALRQHETQSELSHGFRPNRSNYTAATYLQRAMLLAGNYTLIGLDLEAAFPTVKAPDVAKLIRDLFPQWSKWKQHAVTRLMLHKGELATGAPTSPTILNLMLQGMDEEIDKLARRFNGRFIRYADDLVIAIGTHKKHRAIEVQQELRKIVRKFGFKPHPRKHYRKRIGIDSPVAEVVGLKVSTTEIKAKKLHRKKLRAWRMRALHELRETPEECKTWRRKAAGLARYICYVNSRRPPAIAS